MSKYLLPFLLFSASLLPCATILEQDDCVVILKNLTTQELEIYPCYFNVNGQFGASHLKAQTSSINLSMYEVLVKKLVPRLNNEESESKSDDSRLLESSSIQDQKTDFTLAVSYKEVGSWDSLLLFVDRNKCRISNSDIQTLQDQKVGGDALQSAINKFISRKADSEQHKVVGHMYGVNRYGGGHYIPVTDFDTYKTISQKIKNIRKSLFMPLDFLYLLMDIYSSSLSTIRKDTQGCYFAIYRAVGYQGHKVNIINDVLLLSTPSLLDHFGASSNPVYIVEYRSGIMQNTASITPKRTDQLPKADTLIVQPQVGDLSSYSSDIDPTSYYVFILDMWGNVYLVKTEDSTMMENSIAEIKNVYAFSEFLLEVLFFYLDNITKDNSMSFHKLQDEDLSSLPSFSGDAIIRLGSEGISSLAVDSAWEFMDEPKIKDSRLIAKIEKGITDRTPENFITEVSGSVHPIYILLILVSVVVLITFKKYQDQYDEADDEDEMKMT